PIRQAGTYWYHSHSGTQEQTGLYGALILEPRGREPYTYQRDHVVLLSDWTDEEPMTIVSNLKQQPDYYNRHRRTLGTFIGDTRRDGLGATVEDRLMWGQMRMSPTDIMDVTGATYTFLMNGQPPAANWTALFTPGENVRLRFINASAMTTFDVRIPGLDLRVVQADGSDVMPVTVEEFRIGVAETYDVIVRPRPQAYTIFAQAQDRSGYARGTLAPRPGMAAAVPPLDPPPLRTMADMGMSHGGMSHGSHGTTGHGGHGGTDHAKMDHSKMDHAAMGHGMPAREIPVTNADGVDPKRLKGLPSVDNVAEDPKDRLGEAGTGLDGNGRRVLTYRDLRAIAPRRSPPPARAIEFHITGNMERWVWGFNGKKFSEAKAVRVKLGERVRFVMINDTMMEHPIHLHGYLFEVENGQGDRLPLKHTINVKPGERMSFVFTADEPGHWAFHCHLLYHMEMGMFRTVLVS
ncbi:MAG TPA: copper resistance system multicopper oxidase, partial [Reyranella sp.]|nr:copper resistance system multicopper oxidase [Reyranella sp.]